MPWQPILLVLFCLVLLPLLRMAVMAVLRNANDLGAKHAAANAAGTLLVAWLAPEALRIRSAEIAPGEGVALDFDLEQPSIVSMQYLLVTTVAGTAGEAQAFDGAIRTEAMLRDWMSAKKLAAAFIEAGHADLPWMDLIAEGDPGPPLLPDIVLDAQTKTMLRASFLHASAIIEQHPQAFQRLQTLLLERKRLTEQEIDRTLSLMVPRPR